MGWEFLSTLASGLWVVFVSLADIPNKLDVLGLKKKESIQPACGLIKMTAGSDMLTSSRLCANKLSASDSPGPSRVPLSPTLSLSNILFLKLHAFIFTYKDVMLCYGKMARDVKLNKNNWFTI